MYFVVTRHDKAASYELRLSVRPRHLDYLETVIDRIVYGGALLGPDGKQNGSILVINVADHGVAQTFANADRFAAVAETPIEPFEPVFRDGPRIN